MRISRPLIILLLCTTRVVCADDPTPTQPTVAELEYFEKKIRPLLATRCYECHSSDAKTIHGGLTLDNASGLLRGGDSGTAVVAGKPDESLLIESIRYGNDDLQMPPKGKLPDNEIAELVAWVKRGAPYPHDANSKTKHSGEIDFESGRKFWSFQPAVPQPSRTVRNTAWSRQPIDQFILSNLECLNLSPSPEADRATLLRRLSFDLTGLPPTPEQVHDFVTDARSDAWERQVERLLQSLQYGERWARLWLDLARYTDTTASWLYKTGQSNLYRDWVVKALNDDMPYDEFVKRQLATDLMPETGTEDIPALGFLGLSPNYWKELKLPAEIIKVIVADEWEERVDAVSRTFLGLTVACARCHDHKFDPISTEDYYAMAGVFASCRITERPLISEELFEPVRLARAKVATLTKQLTELKKKKPNPTGEINKLNLQIAALKKIPSYDTPMANAVSEESLYILRAGKTPQDGTKLDYRPGPQNLNLFIRGNPNRLGDVVPRRFLTVLSADKPPQFRIGSGRLELANALTEQAASLTARVIVNRIWLAHFGRGLVTTPSNFGQLGERPSHPELLDDLAARFMANGWSLKQLHREIVLSATYRQSSRPDGNPPAAAADADNRLLWRMNRRRLDVEAWRDAMLFVSGRLDMEPGGPSVALEAADNRRRTLYCTIHRRDMSATLLTHDFPDPTSHSPQRINTTTALQGLYALNGPLLTTQSVALAERLTSNQKTENSLRIREAYRRLFTREPTPREIELGLSFLGEGKADAWQQYAHVLLASNEFLYVD